MKRVCIYLLMCIHLFACSSCLHYTVIKKKKYRRFKRAERFLAERGEKKREGFAKSEKAARFIKLNKDKRCHLKVRHNEDFYFLKNQ